MDRCELLDTAIQKHVTNSCKKHFEITLLMECVVFMEFKKWCAIRASVVGVLMWVVCYCVWRA